MDLYGQPILSFLNEYGYWMVIPLMFLEGPITTIFAGLLSSFGILNVWIILFLAIITDVLGDSALYGIGKKWGFNFVNKFGKHIGVTKERILKMEKYFIRHGGKTVFMAKSTTGFCLLTFISAGIFKMNFKKFLKFSLAGGIIWSGGLVLVGYFYGYMWREIMNYIEWIGWVIVFLVILLIVMLKFIRKSKFRKFFNNNI